MRVGAGTGAPGPEWELAGDGALIARFGQGLDEAANRAALAWAVAIRADPPLGVWGVVPGHATLLVEFDPDIAGPEAVLAALRRPPAAPAPPGRTWVIPVVYGGAFGPDLEEAADRLGLPPETLIARHSDRSYRIFCLGFAPGFPLAAPLDASLVLPRRDSPRPRVPAGSVAIAGRQTGIYPTPTPGGWHLIGRTPLTLFNPRITPPARWRPGDRLRFQRITAEMFGRLAERDRSEAGRGPVDGHGRD